MQDSDSDVAVYGLGFVGLTLAVGLAKVGYRVAGLEIREDLRDLILTAKAPFMEPGLTEGIAQSLRNGLLEVLPDDAAVRAPVHIVTVGTPLDTNGRCRLDMVTRVSRHIAGQLREQDLVCLRSTVKVGTTRNVVLPHLEESGLDFKLAYTPERTLEGDALRELRRLPQVVGGLNEESREAAAAFFGRLTSTVIRVSSLEAAELVKLTDNAYRDVRFAFSNEIAAIAGAWGVSGDEVLASARLGYPRSNVADAGPVGGPCLSKDSHILAQSAEAVGKSAVLAKAARDRSSLMHQSVYDRVNELCPPGGRVALLGLAFKGSPPTDDTRGSPSLDILSGIFSIRDDVLVAAYDPCRAVPEASWWNTQTTGAAQSLEVVESWQEACTGADVIVFGNDHPTLLELDLDTILDLAAPTSVIIDMWSARRSNLPPAEDTRYQPWFRV